MPRKIDIDAQELLRLRREGVSLGGLANYFGCSRDTVARRLRKLGIRSKQSGKRHPSWKGGERLDNLGYVHIQKPNHHRATMDGYVRRSVIIWEAFHGKRFPRDRVPHHINGIKTDDSPENILSLLQSEHSSLHNWLRQKGIVLGND